MIIINKKLLSKKNAPAYCELCNLCRDTQPHHIFRRKMGGGSRLDVRINILWICQECHDKCHGPLSEIYKGKCLEAIADRERVSPLEVAKTILTVLSLHKPNRREVLGAVESLPSKQSAMLFGEIMGNQARL